MSRKPAPFQIRIEPGDLAAGFSVALVLIPQSLAYAELAGLPAYVGLYVAALPPIAAAWFASSPFLQTGPTALSAILSFGILSAQFPVGSSSYLGAAALLALLVGVFRLLFGVLRLGSLAYFMSQPVLQGFTGAAGVLIFTSQLPNVLGVSLPSGAARGVFAQLGWTLRHLGEVNGAAVLLSLVTLGVVFVGRRLSPLFPGVLIAVLGGIGFVQAFGYGGPTLGAVPPGLPLPSLQFPWAALPSLLVGALVIAAVGFAEPAAIARTFAREGVAGEGQLRWNPNRELVSQGVANLAAGLFGGFPVGGSFSRSSLNKLAGAKSRWSGLVTGLVTLAFLPFATVLSDLPKAVLGAVIITAVVNLIRIDELVRLWQVARFQALTAYATFALTLLLAPRIDYAVLLGVGSAVALHLYRETQLGVRSYRRDDALVVELSGVLYFGSVYQLEAKTSSLVLTPEVTEVVVDARQLGRVDLSGAIALDELRGRLEAEGVGVRMVHLQPRVRQMLERLRRRAPR